MDYLTASLAANWLGMPIWVWLAFIGIVIVILAIDLGLFHKDAHEITMKESRQFSPALA